MASDLVRVAPEFSHRPLPLKAQPITHPRTPGRDDSHSRWWTPALRTSLDRQMLQERIESGEVIASILPVPGVYALHGGGGNTGGGMPPGGGSGSGGGSGFQLGGSGFYGQSSMMTGNNLIRHHLVGWDSLGASAVSFTLFHNSRGTYNGALGHGWSHSYDSRITTDPGVSSTVRMPDGLLVPYTISGGNYVRPDGWNHTLVRHSNNTYTLTFKNQVKWEYSSAGWLIAVKDRVGNTTAINRNSSNEITSITSADGRTLTFSYASGNISSIQDPLGRTWSFSYNGSDQLTKITYPSIGGPAAEREFTYSTTGHDIIQEKDLRGHNWSWTYDTDGRLETFSNPLNQTTTRSYTSTTTVTTLPGGEATTHTFTNGVLTGITDPEGFTRSFTRNTNRDITVLVDERGQTWNYTYDGWGNQLTARTPLNHTTTTAYTATHDVDTVTTPLGHVTDYSYNGQGLLQQITDPLGRASIRYTYNGNGDILTVRDALNRTTTLDYNARGDLDFISDPGGVVTTGNYDLLGRVTSVSRGSSTTSVGYDDWGRQIEITHPGGAKAKTEYDREGNVVSSEDENNFISRWVYDAAGRNITFTNARGDVETYNYNSNGWKTSVVNGRGHTRTYLHSDRGEVTRLTMPDGAIEQWTYNGTGDTTGYTSPLGFTNQYVYDNAGRMTTVDYPSGVVTTFGYDNSSRQTSMVDSTGTTTWSYNAADELETLAQPQGTTTYTYNVAGQKASMTEVGLGTTNYTYYANGRLWYFIDRHGDQTVFLYDVLGRNHIRVNPNGTSDQMEFDNRDRLTAINVYNSGGSFLRRQRYTYDDANRMLTHMTDGVTTTYTYDPVGQLLSETRPGYTGTYTYDGNGNRLTRTVNGVAETYAYDSGDKLQSVSVGGTPIKTYGYDSAGRTTSVTSSAGTTTLTYDFESRITQISGPGINATYSYNGLDTRVGKTENSVSNTFRRSGAYVTDPVLGDGTASYTPGVSVRSGGNVRYQHTGLKNTDSQTSQAQSVAASRIYDAFGNVVSSSGTWTGPFGYAGNFGYQQDASGLKLLGHRYYDPSTGRFLTRDPIKDGRNWYAYGAGEAAPTTGVDATGLRVTTLYRIINGSGQTMKFGITSYGTKRYKKWWYKVNGYKMQDVAYYDDRAHARADERVLVEEMGGPLNNEPWSPKGRAAREQAGAADVPMLALITLLMLTAPKAAAWPLALLEATVAASNAGVDYLHENDDSWREGIRQGMSRRAGFDVWAY